MKDGEGEKRWVLCPWCKADHALRPFLKERLLWRQLFTPPKEDLLWRQLFTPPTQEVPSSMPGYWRRKPDYRRVPLQKQRNETLIE